jgi:hypothetical protein
MFAITTNSYSSKCSVSASTVILIDPLFGTSVKTASG